MKKLIYLLLLISFQLKAQSTIEVNKSPFAIELSAFIVNDTLKMTCDHRISKVDIFNAELKFDFEKYVYQKEVSIPLKDFPNGKFIVNAMTNHKMIIMVLNVNNQPKKKPDVVATKKKKFIVYVPYNITTTQVRKDHFDSDTIFVKETREMYIRRMDSIRGKKRINEFEKE